MQRLQQRIADQLVGKRQNAGQLVATAVELDPQKADVGHAVHQRTQRRIATLFDDLYRLGFAPCAHRLPSTVKLPVAVATGLPSSSSCAVARTNATFRVT